ncbi:hypothetical protein AB0T83_10720 [Fluviibacterium sp. DFM31]|uniref:Uncharacterized protein n=1 Tax=Meridianimarinicoccus marinus TaxID=3231483 RepID=A0ABV3L8A3_9RHOB
MSLKPFTLAAAAMMLATAPALASDSPIPSSGDQFTVYDTVEGWTVYADGSTKTCLIERTDEAGNAMQMGLTADREFAYVGVFTQAEIDVESGDIALGVGGKVFVGETHAIKSGKLAADYRGGYILTNNPDLVTAIAESQTMIAFPDQPIAFLIDLTGTKKAIESARACNASLAG